MVTPYKKYNAGSLPENIDVHVINSEHMVPQAVEKLVEKTETDLQVYGLDCEWDIMWKKGMVHHPDILQIATVHGFCVLFRLHMLKKIPPQLKRFLENPNYIKVGVGVVDDGNKLRDSFHVNTEGMVDVRYLADDCDVPPKGLSFLANSVLDFNLTKHHHTFHQWTGKLSNFQTQYAALDAIYSARVFYKLSHDRISQIYGDEWKNWSHKEYHTKTMRLWEKYLSKNFEFTRSKFYRNQVLDYMLTLCDLNIGCNFIP